jgi:TetR/AcrR family acrAB operon transcriptional repressor
MRRTKEEAAKTRRRIMESALRAFDRHGIARTTIGDIARDAGVTRGAVYWHFSDKQALLRAIRDSVSLPLLDESDLTLLSDAGGDPLLRIERFLVAFVRSIDRDRATRRALDVMSFKCEYVGALATERGALVRNTNRLLKGLESAYVRARDRGLLRGELSPHVAAIETVAFLSGLVRLLLLDGAASALRGGAPDVIRAHVQSRRAPAARAGAERAARVPRTPREVRGNVAALRAGARIR